MSRGYYRRKGQDGDTMNGVLFFGIWFGVPLIITGIIQNTFDIDDKGLYGIVFWVFTALFLVGGILWSWLSTGKSKHTSHNSQTSHSCSGSYTGSRGSTSSDNSYSGRSSGSHSSRDRAGTTSSNTYSTPYISTDEMNKTLKSLEEKGIDWNTLANDKTDEERESLFIKEFGGEDKGKIANDRFNQTDIYPARERHLEKQINESEFEEDSIKKDLQEKVKSLGGEIPRKDFLNILHDIKTFQEQKKRKDTHIKYEGRLSNKDIQTIKEHLGYICMGCDLDPVREYGESMKGILEAHHKKPFAEIPDGEIRTVEPDDFLILCPTCHRMIHKLSSPDDLDGLKEVLNKNKRTYWWD